MMVAENDGVIMQETAALLAGLFPDGVPSIFIPYIVFLIDAKRYENLEVEVITRDFEEMFAIQLEDLIIEELCREVLVKEYVYKINDCYVSNPAKIKAQQFGKDYETALSRYQDLKTFYREYREKERGLSSLADNEMDEALLKIIRKASIDTEEHEPTTDSPDLEEMALNEFVLYANAEHPEVVDVINQFAVGDALWNVVANEHGAERYFKNGAKIILDTRCVFRLIGLEDEYWKQVFVSFVKNIKECGGEVIVFNHVMDEITSIITQAKKAYKREDFDINRASRVALQFHFGDYNDAKIDQILYDLRNNPLLTYNFTIEDHGYEKDTNQYQIDCDEFKKMLIDTYKGTNPGFDPAAKDQSIETDIRSIIMTYRLRGDASPREVHDADYIFVTTNTGLALTSKKYEKKHGKKRADTVPVCLTANFLSTFIWLSQPTRYIENNKQKLLAYCYAAACPSRDQIKNYFDEIEKLKKNKKYSKAQLQYMRESPTLMRLYTLQYAVAPMGKKPDILDSVEMWQRQNAQYTKKLEDEIARRDERDLKSQKRIELYQKDLTAFVDKIMGIFENIVLKIATSLIPFGFALYAYIYMGSAGLSLLSAFLGVIFTIFGVWEKSKKGQTTLRGILKWLYNVTHVNELAKQSENIAEGDSTEAVSEKE